jgi:glycosidase
VSRFVPDIHADDRPGANNGALPDWPPADPLETPPDDAGSELPPSVEAHLAGRGIWRVTFFYLPPPDTHAVTIAGSFNDWSPEATALRGPRGDGYWYADVELPGGEHQYKFVVDGAHWRADPDNPMTVADGRGDVNSVIKLGRTANLNESPASRGDGRIDPLGLAHDPLRSVYFQALSDNAVLIRLRTLANDVEHVKVAVRNLTAQPMHRARQDDVFELWEAVVRLPGEQPRQRGERSIEYCFLLEDGDLRATSPDTYEVSFSQDDVFHTPGWSHDAVWYQIMPDRFRNGDPSNDPKPTHPWTSAWFNRQPWEGDDNADFYDFVFERNYGGDIAGIEEKLDYLADLGVNALYLNPIFIGDSFHKYNARNYLHIDPAFGVGWDKDDYDEIVATEDLNEPSTWKWTKSDKRFLKFMQNAKRRGFRVIIDGVFNHVGKNHIAFRDVREHRQHSRYADWFNVTRWDPFEYTGWGGFSDLPEFRKTDTGLASDGLTQHIFGVTQRWLAPDGNLGKGIDGWRLDVPNELPHQFWVEWRRFVKRINPDAYITGEIWDEADLWLDGHHFDAVMNYQFAHAVMKWIINRDWKITVSEFDRRLEALRFAYPWPATLAMQNLMNSHDTDRLASMVHNPDRDYDMGNRIQDNGPNYDPSKPSAAEYQRARLIALLQMTYVGGPMIYYGDEVGMWGADDPSCRKPMLWKDLEPYEQPEENHVMPEQHDFYRAVIKLRQEHAALRSGGFQTLLTDDEADVWVFLRTDGHEQLIVALNAAECKRKVRVPVPGFAARQWTGIFGASKTYRVTRAHLTLEIPRVSGVVLHAEAPRQKT